MVRWQPDSRGRLGHAAITLYAEKGFESTTVAEIAERAGLTERTFFRYFSDKREVLFAGGDDLRDLLVAGIVEAPKTATPIEMVKSSLEQACTLLEDRREFSRLRQQVVAASPELQERELIKLAHFSVALADALRRRGVKNAVATMSAEVGITVFRFAFVRWTTENSRRSLVQRLQESFADVQRVASSLR